MKRLLAVAAAALALVAVAPATVAAGQNKNTVTFEIRCGAFGTFTGTLQGGAGSALHTDGAGVSIAMGLATVGGQIISDPAPGLLKQGKLVQCEFTFPGQPTLVAFAFFPQAR